MNVEQIRQAVVDGHLMRGADIDAHVRQWQDEQSSPDDGSGLVATLVAQQEITEFQAQALLAGIVGPYSLGPYRVYDRVVSGRLGSIFRGVHEEFDQTVGLKVFPSSTGDEPERAARLAREMRVAVQIDHANVVRTYQVGRVGDNVFLAIEDLQGETLLSRLDREAQNLSAELPASEACLLVRDVALGLAHVHSLEIVLRDIQPGNIWLTLGNRAKLMEFGAARDGLAHLDTQALLAENTDGDSPGGDDEIVGISSTLMSTDLLGDYDYLAPEQGANVLAADVRSDIYALGCVFFQCLTGEVVFPDDNPVRKMLRHALEPARNVRDVLSDISPALADVVARMLAKQPDDRYQRAEDVASDLNQLIDRDEDPSTETVALDPGFLQWVKSTKELAPDDARPAAKSGLLGFLSKLVEQDESRRD